MRDDTQRDRAGDDGRQRITAGQLLVQNHHDEDDAGQSPRAEPPPAIFLVQIQETDSGTIYPTDPRSTWRPCVRLRILCTPSHLVMIVNLTPPG